jgi:hypothetical protein
LVLCDGSGYACGADGFCHAPGGVIGDETAHPELDADRFMVADIDGDHIGDAVGVSLTSVVTRFGDAAGTLDRSSETLTRGGEPTFVDFSRDGTPDVLIAARDGLTAFASQQHVMSPYAIAFELPGRLPVAARAVIPIDGKRVVVLVDDPLQPSHLSGGILDITSSAFSVQDLPLCDSTFTTADFDPAFVSYYDTSPISAPLRSVAISFVAKDGMGNRRLCGLVVAEDPRTDPVTVTPFVGSTTDPPDHPLVLSDIDGSGCPALIDSSTGPATLKATKTGPSTIGGITICTYTGVVEDLPPYPGAASDAAIGRVSLTPAIAGMAPDALVLASGIYAVGATDQRAHPVYASDRPLAVAAAADINGDGKLDGIVAGNDDTLDILYRNADSFLRQRLATHAPPRQLTVGDFDGNGVPDVAYVEQQSAALDVVYGTLDRPLPPTTVAELEEPRSLVAIALPDSVDPNDVVADLGVIDQRASYEAVEPFHGSPDRSLVPFLDPRGENPGSAFRAAVAGHFVPGDTGLDVLGIELADPGTRATPASLWRLEGEDKGAITLSVGPLASSSGMVPMPGVDDCTRTTAAVCLDGARFLAWPTSATDLLVVVDAHNARVDVFDPGGLDYSPSTTDELTLAAGAPLADQAITLLAAFAADLDGDGTPELVVAFDDGLVACHLTAGAVTCDDLVAPAGLPAGCRDAAAGRFERLGHTKGEVPAAGAELVVLCDSAVYRLAQGQATLLATLPLPPDAITAIEVGDVTGDAVDDLLVTAIDSDNVRRLHVYPQETSQEVDR